MCHCPLYGKVKYCGEGAKPLGRLRLRLLNKKLVSLRHWNFLKPVFQIMTNADLYIWSLFQHKANSPPDL